MEILDHPGIFGFLRLKYMRKYNAWDDFLQDFGHPSVLQNRKTHHSSRFNPPFVTVDFFET
ncbi:MAG: hypothetical protein IKU20_04030 [Lachnospiraceae bacterium]|nr:hypothetical protein [Lachnospiraceae bacterium]